MVVYEILALRVYANAHTASEILVNFGGGAGTTATFGVRILAFIDTS